jgi:hypothetical protein
MNQLLKRQRRLLRFALVLTLVCSAGAVPAMAEDLALIPPEEQPYLINSSATGVDALEGFIETPGTSFNSPGFVNLDAGWTDVDINPGYSVEYGTLSAALTEDLNVSGSSSFIVYLYGFTGCASLQPISACPVADLTDAYAVTFSNGNYQGWTPLPAAGLPGENISVAYTSDESASGAPEPTTITLIGGALAALGFLKRKATTVPARLRASRWPDNR